MESGRSFTAIGHTPNPSSRRAPRWRYLTDETALWQTCYGRPKDAKVQNRTQWRAWLEHHHTSSPGVWLVLYKKHTRMESIPYEDAVREALCFGWIDSLIKRIDEDRHARKFTPRKPISKWSEINRRRWAELRDAGLLTPAGIAAAPTDNRYAPLRKVANLPAYIAKRSEE